jgi:hypothetical protein
MTLVSLKDFSPADLSQAPPLPVEGGFASALTYRGGRCIMQTPKCVIAGMDWETGTLELEVPGESRFATAARAINQTHVEFAKTLRGALFPLDLDEGVLERMYRPSVSGNRVYLRFDPHDPFPISDSETGDVCPVEEFQDGRSVRVMFEVRGLGFGQSVYGATWSVLKARVDVPPPEPKTPVAADPEPEVVLEDTEVPEPEPEPDFVEDEDEAPVPCPWTNESQPNFAERVPML